MIKYINNDQTNSASIKEIIFENKIFNAFFVSIGRKYACQIVKQNLSHSKQTPYFFYLFLEHTKTRKNISVNMFLKNIKAVGIYKIVNETFMIQRLNEISIPTSLNNKILETGVLCCQFQNTIMKRLQKT